MLHEVSSSEITCTIKQLLTDVIHQNKLGILVGNGLVKISSLSDSRLNVNLDLFLFSSGGLRYEIKNILAFFQYTTEYLCLLTAG